MADEAERTITYPCPHCRVMQKHKLEPVVHSDSTYRADCMECGNTNGWVGEINED